MVSIDASSAGRKLIIVAPLLLLVVLTIAVDITDLPGNGPPGSQSGEAVPIQNCREINSSGTYVLTKDFGGAAGLASGCLEINASDVTINGSGHTIQGRGVTDTTGVIVGSDQSVSNVEIHSVRVERWNRGIHVTNASDVTIRNVTVVRSAEGIAVWNGTRVSVENSWVTNNLFGVVIDEESRQVTFSSVHFRNNRAANTTHGRGQYRQSGG
ncbi:right-handed parallel beta-helix repeat-containing protein [Haladaptatus salinisoli]|uniref:right-handed parallel beta-helix repeat-containing protein n=1 Tax=Haladaptatus salinisoli TaxID=2884876 RepID=UPI001D0A5B95|nr:right-handed parallel beta-helix repeat-containing protein [Haladaptatus salinisoli]